jgi:hypothetical protein
MVTYGLDIQVLPDCLHIVLTGLWSPSTGPQIIRDVRDACAETGRSRILFDLREHVSDSDTLSEFQLAKDVAHESWKARVERVAVLSRPELREQDAFFELVASNRGMTIRYFYDLDEAVRWLKA